MVDFKDYRFDKNNLRNALDKLANDIDNKVGKFAGGCGNGDGVISGNEKSIFLENAVEMYNFGKITDSVFTQAFGKYEEGMKYTPFRDVDAESYGEEIREKLFMHINSDDDYEEAADMLSEIDKTNAYQFMTGVKNSEEKDTVHSEGFIEILDDEWGAEEAITMDIKKNLIISLVDQALDLGIPESNRCIGRIRKILKDYEPGGKYADATTFNHNHSYDYDIGAGAAGSGAVVAAIGTHMAGVAAVAKAGATAGATAGAAATFWSGGWGAIVGGVAGAVAGGIAAFSDQTTDNERLDKAMKGLYDEMTKKYEEIKANKNK